MIEKSLKMSMELIQAVENGEVEVAEEYLRNGINSNTVDTQSSVSLLLRILFIYYVISRFDVIGTIFSAPPCDIV